MVFQIEQQTFNTFISTHLFQGYLIRYIESTIIMLSVNKNFYETQKRNEAKSCLVFGFLRRNGMTFPESVGSIVFSFSILANPEYDRNNVVVMEKSVLMIWNPPFNKYATKFITRKPCVCCGGVPHPKRRVPCKNCNLVVCGRDQCSLVSCFFCRAGTCEYCASDFPYGCGDSCEFCRKHFSGKRTVMVCERCKTSLNNRRGTVHNFWKRYHKAGGYWYGWAR